jgi:hypothetical protein
LVFSRNEEATDASSRCVSEIAMAMCTLPCRAATEFTKTRKVFFFA